MSGLDRGHRAGCPGLPEFKGVCDCGAVELWAQMWRMTQSDPVVDARRVPIARMPILRERWIVLAHQLLSHEERDVRDVALALLAVLEERRDGGD